MNRFAYISALLLLLGAIVSAADEPTTPAALKDPIGAYRKKCLVIVGERWEKLVKNSEDKSVFAGHARIAFDVLPEGRPKNFEVVEQSPDAESVRRTALMAAAMSRFNPIPKEVLSLLDGKPLRIEATFKFTSQKEPN